MTDKTSIITDSAQLIGRLNHVAIAVPDLDAAANTYRNLLGADISPAVDLPEHGVTTIFVELPKAGAHGKPVLFLHPKDFCGTLIELEQV